MRRRRTERLPRCLCRQPEMPRDRVNRITVGNCGPDDGTSPLPSSPGAGFPASPSGGTPEPCRRQGLSDLLAPSIADPDSPLQPPVPACPSTHGGTWAGLSPRCIARRRRRCPVSQEPGKLSGLSPGSLRALVPSPANGADHLPVRGILPSSRQGAGAAGREQSSSRRLCGAGCREPSPAERPRDIWTSAWPCRTGPAVPLCPGLHRAESGLSLQWGLPGSPHRQRVLRPWSYPAPVAQQPEAGQEQFLSRESVLRTAVHLGFCAQCTCWPTRAFPL